MILDGVFHCLTKISSQLLTYINCCQYVDIPTLSSLARYASKKIICQAFVCHDLPCTSVQQTQKTHRRSCILHFG